MSELRISPHVCSTAEGNGATTLICIRNTWFNREYIKRLEEPVAKGVNLECAY